MNIMITGATSGIGYQLTLQYAAQGHQIIACGRNQQKLDLLTNRSANIRSRCFDLNDYHNYPDPGAELDLLILNAGDCAYIDNSLEFDAALLERVININLISVGYGLERWLKHLSTGGRVVFVSSSACFLPLPRAEAYGASKAALSYLAKTLSITLAKHNIAVSVVHPGFVDTPLTARNTFDMPMMINSNQAAEAIIQGIAKGKTEINFPTRFTLLMKFLTLLPFAVWQKLASKMV